MLIENWLKEKIRDGVAPNYLEIVNESHNHSSTVGNETHFKVICSSPNFVGLSSLERHRKVNALVKEAFSMGLHALALHLYTPQEMETKKIPKSPLCVNSD